MDGVLLSSIGPILIKEAYENAPTMMITNADRPGRAGQIESVHKRQALRVALELQIREVFDLTARSNAIDQLAKWAHGRVL